MQVARSASGTADVDPCAEARAAVTTLCARTETAHADHAQASEGARSVRRELSAARHELEAAEEAADPGRRTEEKARARQIYEQARQVAVDDAERAEATADWARALDRINRTGRNATRALSAARSRAGALEARRLESERAENAARIAAEAADAACLEARARLASCEEEAHAPAAAPPVPSPFDPHAATGGHAASVPEVPRLEPLVIESMVMGDRRALELAGATIAKHTGLPSSELILQLQELVDAIVSVASSEGYLLFDEAHPFWAHLSVEEARDVVGALARLGFQFEPSEGWHAGRVPTPSDLKMALAYAGQDARTMRELPTAEDLRALPSSIGVDARSFLARVAPDLAVDHLVGALQRRAKPLEPLWDEWGQVRPVLLSDRRSLGQDPA